MTAHRPRLLIVLASDSIGGAETKTHSLIQGLSSFEITLLTRAAVAPHFRDLDVRCETLGPQPLAIAPGPLWAHASRVARCVRHVRPDVVLGINFPAGLLLGLARDVFRIRAPLCLTVEGHLTGYLASLRGPPSRGYELFLRYILSRKLLIAPSSGVRADLIQRFGVDAAQVEAIPNGIDLARVARLAREGEPEAVRRPTLVTACRLHRDKDFPTLLEAFRMIRAREPAQLVLLGDGPLRDDIRRQAEALGVAEHVLLQGYVENPFPRIAAADVFVLSSHSEGFGLALVEAMSLGVPVVSTDCPCGPREIITDGLDGFLVPLRDPAALAGRCLEILQDPALRARLSVAGSRRASAFELAPMADRYDEVLRRRAGLPPVARAG